MPTVTYRPLASADDAWRRVGNAFFSLPGLLTAGASSSTMYANGAGIRFPAVAIPQGAVITSATLTLIADSAVSGVNCKTRIQGEKVVDAPAFSDAANFDPRRANMTTASVPWDNIPAWAAGTSYVSPDIASVISEIVGQAGWASGNDLVLFWHDYDDRSTHATGNHRSAKSYDRDPASAPLLTVTYEGEPPPPTYSVAISTPGNGTISPASLTGLDATTGKTFTATPSVGYKVATVTSSPGVTVTPEVDGTAGAKTFTVNATQDGTVVVRFGLPPSPPILTYSRATASKQVAATASIPAGDPTGYKFLLDDVLVATQASRYYTYTIPDSAEHLLTAKAYNADGDSTLSTPVSVTIPASDPAWWTAATSTGGTYSKTAFTTADSVGPGGYVFGQTTDLSNMFSTAYHLLRSTDDGYALVADPGNAIWASGWLAHDKTLPFECEVEFFSSMAAMDAALVCYSSEINYHHAAKFDPGNTSMTNGVMRYDDVAWNPAHPDGSELVNKWLKLGYQYIPQFNAATGKTESYVIGKLTVDGVTYTSAPNLYTLDVTTIQHPIAAPSQWTPVTDGNLTAYRNLRVINGHLSSFSADFGRWSGIEATSTVRANGGGAWTYQLQGGTTHTYINGALTLYFPADGTARIEGTGTVELPLVTIPDSLAPISLNFKSNQMYYAIKDEAGNTLLSGQSVLSNGVTSVDLSGITSRTIRPVFTLDTALNGTPSLYWADFSWTPPMELATDVVASVMDGTEDIHLHWTDNATDNVGYTVERRVDGGAWEALASVGDVELYFDTDTPPAAGWISLQYRVAPSNANGDGTFAESNILWGPQPVTGDFSAIAAVTASVTEIETASGDFSASASVSASVTTIEEVSGSLAASADVSASATVIEAANNAPAAFTPTVTSVTASGATVAFGTTDPDGDTVLYRLKVTTSPTPPATWNVADVTSPQVVTGLPASTQHWAHVRAYDGQDPTVGSSQPFTTAAAPQVLSVSGSFSAVAAVSASASQVIDGLALVRIADLKSAPTPTLGASPSQAATVSGTHHTASAHAIRQTASIR